MGSEVADDPAQPVIPRHGGPVLVNHGNNYVYGDLSWSGDCLRISYSDHVDRYRTRDGLLLVWPAGFDVQLSGDVVEVVGADGSVVAAVGQTLRVSGKRVPDKSAAVDEWDWDGGDGRHCAGPYWLVGDEVTTILTRASGVASDDGIVFPRIGHQRGPIVSPLAGVPGRLMLHGRCLLLEVPWPPGEYLVVWPPGFRVQDIGDDLFVLNGGGNVIVRVGDEVTLGRNSGPDGATTRMSVRARTSRLTRSQCPPTPVSGAANQRVPAANRAGTAARTTRIRQTPPTPSLRGCGCRFRCMQTGQHSLPRFRVPYEDSRVNCCRRNACLPAAWVDMINP